MSNSVGPLLGSKKPSAAKPSSAWLWVFAAFWMMCAVAGLWVLWAYENKPGIGAQSPRRWPADTTLVRAHERPTLILLAHPQCSCTRASLGELAEVLGRTRTPPKTFVLFLRPSSFFKGWEKTDLWQAASSLPNVTVMRDDDGLEAEKFGAVTSGQTLLYDSDGTLLFSGGITGARGHAGDNAGRAAILALLDRKDPGRRSTSVFGCSLFARETDS